MTRVCRSAVDTDEIAAHLEANGVNDRIAARDYGAADVFTLAARMRAEQSGHPVPGPAARPAVAQLTVPRIAGAVVAIVVRTCLYLTPAVVAIGTAELFTGLAAPAGPGALIFGWACAQALAFLGYRALGAGGPAPAARTLGIGFVAATLGWAAVMFSYGVTDPWSHAVAAGQMALFATTSVALVTGTERRVLAAAAGVWAATALAASGAGPAGRWLIVAAVVALVAVAYLPALRRGGRFRPRAAEAGTAFAHGAVGAGQAVLFASVVLAGADPGRIPAAAVPLLLGVPLAELLLAWHQRRVIATRAALTDRWQYGPRLARVSAATVAVLVVPVASGAALAIGGTGRLAAAVLLTSVFALCLVLVAHRRLGLATLLVWWPAVLIGVLLRTLPTAGAPLVDTLMAVVLFAVCVPALGVVALVLGDRWSYR
jgi:hypothetical protein